jgi:hypothetical protein
VGGRPRVGGIECRVDKRATTPTPVGMYSEQHSGLGRVSKRTSIVLEEVIELHRFAGLSPEKFLTEAGRLREAMVAAD